MKMALVAAMLVAAVGSLPSSSLTRAKTTIAESSLDVENAGTQFNFQLSLDREYGRARYRRCRLGVVVFENRGSSQLWCEHNAPGNVPALFKREELSAKETLSLTSLVERASLYQGGHIGVDTTASDGMFETLKLTAQRGTVVLVTSGNTTFESDPVRKELLSKLHGFENRPR